MGIVNATPDSFLASSRLATCDAAVRYAEQLWNEGADLLDIGGESTRPHHTPVSLAVECERVVPVIRRLAARITGVRLSIDTAKAEVAAAALDAGATILNDTSCGDHDTETAAILKCHPQAHLVLMHRPHPRTEQRAISDNGDIVRAVVQSLTQRAAFFGERGVQCERIVFDVGLGFGKTAENNWRLVDAITSGALSGLGPLLVGHSRKRFLQTTTETSACFHPSDERELMTSDTASSDARLAATLALSERLVASAPTAGVVILRVHDIAAHRRLLKP